MQDSAIQIGKIEPGRLTPALLAQIDAIFFGAATRTFPPGPEREAFRERWLGRYLDGGSDALFLAIEGDDTVAGYLVGAVENPALQDRFADIAYFRTDFAELCRQFPGPPAHQPGPGLPQSRHRRPADRGVRRLCAAGHGAAGMHVVTGAGMRNVRFYERCGFQRARRGRAKRRRSRLPGTRPRNPGPLRDRPASRDSGPRPGAACA